MVRFEFPCPAAFFSRTGPASRSASRSPHEGSSPIPDQPEPSRIGRAFPRKSCGFSQHHSSGECPARSGAIRSISSPGNRGSMASACPSADFQQGMAAGLQHAGQQPRQGPIGIQPVRAAIQGRTGLETATRPAPVIRCRRTGCRAGWRRPGRRALPALSPIGRPDFGARPDQARGIVAAHRRRPAARIQSRCRWRWEIPSAPRSGWRPNRCPDRQCASGALRSGTRRKRLLDQGFGIGARHQHAGTDLEIQAPEFLVAGDVGEGLVRRRAAPPAPRNARACSGVGVRGQSLRRG